MIEVVDLLYKNPHELIKTPNQEESMKNLLLEEVIVDGRAHLVGVKVVGSTGERA